MNSRFPQACIACSFMLCLTPYASADLIANGNVEDFSSGVPDNWTYNASGGPSSIESSITSPFTNVYTVGTRSVLLSDVGTTGGLSPSLRQNFPAEFGKVSFNFDFMLPSATLSTNEWTVGLQNDSNPFSFSISDSFHVLTEDDGTKFTSNFVRSLSGNVWYNVSAIFDPIGTTVSGQIREIGGAAVNFSKDTSTGFTQTSRVRIIDGAFSGLNDDIHFDNISVTSVPEPSSLLMLGIVGAGVSAIRRRKRISQIGK